MIDGNVNELVEQLNCGGELWFNYKNLTYFYQGY